MKTWVRKTLSAGVLAAGALLLAPTAAAQADSQQNSFDNVGVLNGTQVVMPVKVPVNLVGNAIGVAGEANSRGFGVNHIESGRSGKRVQQNSFDNVGVLNGTQVYLPVTVPVNVAGNAAAVLGEANAAGAAANRLESGKTTEHGWDDGIQQNSFDNVGIGNGTQLAAPITVPINVCGNSLALLGEANSAAVCGNVLGSSRSKGGHWRKVETTRGGWDGGIQQNSFDNVGILNGTQLAAPITVPVNACGNAVGVLFGEANASGACFNNLGGVFDRGHGGWVRPGHGHWVKPGHGHDDDDNLGDGGNLGDECPTTGDVRGDDDKGYCDDGDVKGDGGDKGYGDVKGGNKGYGDVQDDKYSDGGRGEKSPVSDLTGGLNKVGGSNVAGLDLLNTLR